LCLTYNVTLAKSRCKKGIKAPSYGATTVAISKLLDDWRKNEDRQKIAVILDHRYTQDSLSMDTLKGIDRARAEVLFEAAEQADCVAHLALVTLWQSGEAEGGYDEYSYRGGYRRYHRSDFEDDDDFDETGDDYEIGEIYDYSLSANHWSDCKGKKVGLGEIRLDEDDIVSEAPLDYGDPDSEDFEGFTGNAGMTLERWYHRAAIVLWPRDKHFAVLCGAGTDAAIGGLQPPVNRLKRMSFLANPDRKQGRFPLAKKRRQHLHQIIDGNLCNLTHVTERRGSPFTLVCTKTTASYEAACKIHRRDLQNLSRIIALENKTS